MPAVLLRSLILLFDDEDDEAIMTLPVYFGGPCVADDKLFHRLHERLGTV